MPLSVFCIMMNILQFLESVASVASLKSKESESIVSKEFLHFIDSKCNFLKTLVIDVEGSLEIRNFPERLLAFSLYGQKQLSLFKQNTLREQGLMMKVAGKQLGASLEEYIAYIQYEILLEKSNDTEIFNFGAKNIMRFKIKVGNVHDTIEYLLIPKLFTLYYQEKMDISYKAATRYLYQQALPTTHHISTRLKVSCYVFNLQYLIKEAK